LKTVPVKASFQHRNGALVEIRRYLREVNITDDHQQETWIEGQKLRIQKRLVALLAGGGHPPDDDDLGANVHLGRLAITYDQAKHIWDQRMAAHQKDPKGHPHPSKVLADIAEAAVMGKPSLDPTVAQSGATCDRIWLTHGKHLVTVTPFWGYHAGDKQGASDRLWLVSGYQMDPVREQQAKTAQRKSPLPAPKDKIH
jgi:hypothetical protein